jgi:hypothetical protein
VKKAFYIAEINLPNTSAYAQHVLKMCESLSLHYNVTLIILYKDPKYSFKKIKHEYLLKKNFRILSFNKKLSKINFFIRLKYAIFAKSIIEKDSLIISRSPVVSFFLAIKGYFNFLEIHHNLKSITKYIFLFLKLFKFFNKIYFIFTHQNLKKILGIYKNYLILDDCVDIDDFQIKNKKINYSCTYIGSFYEGKGIEIIKHLSKKFTNLEFHLFGDLKTLKESNLINFRKNLIFHDFKPYCEIVNIISKSRILLMPYLTEVRVRSSNIDVAEVMSPMKLFQYLASRRLIIASDLPVYSHVLKNKFNCLLASPKNLKDWESKLRLAFSSKLDVKRITYNAYITAGKFTWKKRVEKINNRYNLLRAK